MLNFEQLETDVFEESPSHPVSKVLPVVELAVSDAIIEQYREEFSGLIANTREGYEDVRKAIAVCRTTRTGIEKKRKELNEDARQWINTVNSEAKRLTIAIEGIEEPLKAKKQVVDDEKERIKREAEDARQRKINDRIVAFLTEAGVTCSVTDAEKWTDEEFEAKLAEARALHLQQMESLRLQEEERQRVEAERAEEMRRQQEEIERQRSELERMRAEQEAELAKIRAEQERARLEYEAAMAKVREEQEAIARAEREKLEAERAALRAERDRVAAEEKARQEAIHAEQEAARIAEVNRLAEERAKQEAIELQARLEALKPDLEKVAKYRTDIEEMIKCASVPEIGNQGLVVAVRAFRNHLLQVCEDFSGVAARSSE
jgi:hypothetical protein